MSRSMPRSSGLVTAFRHPSIAFEFRCQYLLYIYLRKNYLYLSDTYLYFFSGWAPDPGTNTDRSPACVPASASIFVYFGDMSCKCHFCTAAANCRYSLTPKGKLNIGSLLGNLKNDQTLSYMTFADIGDPRAAHREEE